MEIRKVFISSLLIIFLALYGLYKDHNKMQSQANKPNPIATSKVQEAYIKEKIEQEHFVFAAKNDIKKGAILTRNKFNLVKIRADNLVVECKDYQENISFAADIRAKKDLGKDEFLLSTSIAYPGSKEYINLILRKGYIPFDLDIPVNKIIGVASINPGDLVDIVVFSSKNKNLAIHAIEEQFKQVTMESLLPAVKVLQVVTPVKESLVKNSANYLENSSESQTIHLVLEITPKNLSKLVLALRVADVEFIKHIPGAEKQYFTDSIKILPQYNSVISLRAKK